MAKLYNAIAQVTYKNGIWKGGFGLPTVHGFAAKNATEAKRIAKTHYERMNDYVLAKKNHKSVKLHLSVEEAY